jgi:hypothetical protein
LMLAAFPGVNLYADRENQHKNTWSVRHNANNTRGLAGRSKTKATNYAQVRD